MDAEIVMVTLGYPELQPRVKERLLANKVVDGQLATSPERATRITKLLLEVTDIDTLLSEARVNSMAQQLGTMKLDFQYHIQSLKADASLKLAEMSRLSGIPVFFDRYSGTYPAAPELYTMLGTGQPSDPNKGYVASSW